MNSKKQTVTASFLLRPIELLIENFARYFLIFIPIWALAIFSLCLVKLLYQDIIQQETPQILLDLVLVPFAALIFFKIASHFFQNVKLDISSQVPKTQIVLVISILFALVLGYENLLILLERYSHQYIIDYKLSDNLDLSINDYTFYVYLLIVIKFLFKSVLYLPISIILFSYIHKQIIYDKEIFSLVKKKFIYLFVLTLLFLAVYEWFNVAYHMILNSMGLRGKITSMISTQPEIIFNEIYNFFYFLLDDFIWNAWNTLYFGWMYLGLFQLKSNPTSN